MNTMYMFDLGKILLACLLGGLVGQQRQRKGMSIGFRTHIIVCVSATLVQIISIDYNFLHAANIDVMRLGAQVISGIGFLGMASIIKDGRNIVGLTTAASMWAISCVGLAVGSGLYIPAVIVTFIIYATLIDAFNLDKRIGGKRYTDAVCELEIVFNGLLTDKSKINLIIESINQKELTILNTNINTEDKSSMILHLTLSLPQNKVYNEIVEDLLHYDYIKKINIA